METHNNTAYGVVPARREEPEYEVIPLSQNPLPAYSKKVETHSNTAYGVVPTRREEPVYEVITLSQCPTTASGH